MTAPPDDLNELVYGHAIAHPTVENTIGAVTGAIVDAFVARAPEFADDLVRNLGTIENSRQQIRDRLLADGRIIPIGSERQPAASIAAIDGGVVIEPMYAADLMAAVAVSAEGLTITESKPVSSATWAQISAHAVGNESVARLRMLVLELGVLSEISHDLRFIDGSPINAYIALSQALYGADGPLADASPLVATAVELAQHPAIGTAANLISGGHEPTRVVALAKADVGTAYAETILRDYDIDAKVVDKTLAALVLEPGEMFRPIPATSRGHMNVVVRDTADPQIKAAAHRINTSLAPIRDAIANNAMVITYLKPETGITAIKAQFVTSSPADPVPDAARIARLIADETPGPDLQEPFPQYAADLAAKNVSHGVNALRQSMLTALPPEASDYLALILRGYRT
jgi:hypothetical protein